MVKLTQSNPKCFDVLLSGLSDLQNYQEKVGWFESSVYENGEPVAYIAAIQDQGAVIQHPGGTPYKIGPDGMATFVSKSTPGAEALPKTKPHTIVIPPRPFMIPTVNRERENWSAIIKKNAPLVLDGKLSAKELLDAVGLRAASDIAKTISEITAPKLATSTINKRRNSMTDKKTIGNLTKPLVASGLLMNTVDNVTEAAE